MPFTVAPLTIEVILKWLLPKGTRRNGVLSWHSCPLWPPDVFAVVATIAEMSGCYSEPGIVLSNNDTQRKQKRLWAERSKLLAEEWSKTNNIPKGVKDLWKTIYDNRVAKISDISIGTGIRWKLAVIRLLAVTDEGCLGVGFIPAPDGLSCAQIVFEEYLKFNQKGNSRLQLPHSIAHLIHSDLLCIFPKSRTPETGCTLRSLSSNLCLLPNTGIVKPRWDITMPPGMTNSKKAPVPQNVEDDPDFNILLIPFPYEVLSSDFEVSRAPQKAPDGKGADGYFKIRQNWLSYSGRAISALMIADFVKNLILTSKHDCTQIHAVIFPELALRADIVEEVAANLAQQFPSIELVISGVLSEEPSSTRNQAVLVRLAERKIAGVIKQNKHHRWVLDKSQIAQYHLAPVLNPDERWWEHIDVHGREIQFGLNRHQAVVVPLVCEDLARFDPVLPIINAVGPNLVIALLMDGPQLESRWPGRYATVLADDPGSAVLTFTSLGMVTRSRRLNEDVRRTIALWKDRSTSAKEIYLPTGDHAVVLCLKAEEDTQKLLDFRGASGTLTNYKFFSARPIRLSDPPKWISRS